MVSMYGHGGKTKDVVDFALPASWIFSTHFTFIKQPHCFEEQ